MSNIDNSIEQNIKENGSLTAQELIFLQGKMKNAEGGAYKETFLNTLDQKFQISQKMSFFAGKSENLWTAYNNLKNTFGLNTGEKETESLVMMKMYWNLKNPNNKMSPIDGSWNQSFYDKLKEQKTTSTINSDIGIWTTVGGSGTFVTGVNGNSYLDKSVEKTVKSYNPGDIVKERIDFKGNIFSPLYNSPGATGGLGAYSDLRRYYLGYEARNGKLIISKYSPPDSKEKTQYIAINNPKRDDYIIALYNHISYIENNKISYQDGFKRALETSNPNRNIESIFNNFKDGDSTQQGPIKKAGKSRIIPRYYTTIKGNDYEKGCLGSFKLGFGSDLKGEYISYYDIRDTNGGAELLGAGKEFEIYNRIYIKKNSTGIYEKL